MKMIWKYELNLRTLRASDAGITVQLPQGGRIIHADFSPMSMHEDVLCYWYEFDHSLTAHKLGTPPRTESSELYVYGTGYEIPDSAEHRATVVGRSFVWHLYERPRR